MIANELLNIGSGILVGPAPWAELKTPDFSSGTIRTTDEVVALPSTTPGIGKIEVRRAWFEASMPSAERAGKGVMSLRYSSVDGKLDHPYLIFLYHGLSGGPHGNEFYYTNVIQEITRLAAEYDRNHPGQSLLNQLLIVMPSNPLYDGSRYRSRIPPAEARKRKVDGVVTGSFDATAAGYIDLKLRLQKQIAQNLNISESEITSIDFGTSFGGASLLDIYDLLERLNQDNKRHLAFPTNGIIVFQTPFHDTLRHQLPVHIVNGLVVLEDLTNNRKLLHQPIYQTLAKWESVLNGAMTLAGKIPDSFVRTSTENTSPSAFIGNIAAIGDKSFTLSRALQAIKRSENPPEVTIISTDDRYVAAGKVKRGAAGAGYLPIGIKSKHEVSRDGNGGPSFVAVEILAKLIKSLPYPYMVPAGWMPYLYLQEIP